jgi:hypothetical protein
VTIPSPSVLGWQARNPLTLTLSPFSEGTLTIPSPRVLGGRPRNPLTLTLSPFSKGEREQSLTIPSPRVRVAGRVTPSP